MKCFRAVVTSVVALMLMSAMICAGEELPKKESAPKEAAQVASDTDPIVGKTFTGCGKEWLVGKSDIDWTATQAWIKGLGEGWKAPTKAELQALFDEIGQKSPVGEDFVWAETRDANSAWHFSFYYHEARWGYFDDHSRYGRAVAVRSK